MAVKNRQTQSVTYIRPAYGQFVTGYGDKLKELGNAIEGFIVGVHIKISDNDDYEDSWLIDIIDFDNDRLQLQLVQDNFRSLKAINRLASVRDFSQPFFFSASKADRDVETSPTNMGIRQFSWDSALLDIAYQIPPDNPQERKEGVVYGPVVKITGYTKKGKRQIPVRDWTAAQKFYNQVVEKFIQPKVEAAKNAISEKLGKLNQAAPMIDATFKDEESGMTVHSEVPSEVPGGDWLEETDPTPPPFDPESEQKEYDDLPM